MKKYFFCFAVVLLSLLTQLSAIAQPTLPTGSGTFINFHTLTGSGTVNGVSFTWTSTSRSGAVQSFGCAERGIDPVAWLDNGMTTTINFSAAVSNIGFVVWGVDGSEGIGTAGAPTDLLQVDKNGSVYSLSAGELIDNRLCATNDQQSGATVITGGKLAAATSVFQGYTVVKLNTSGITTLKFTSQGPNISGIGFAGIFAASSSCNAGTTAPSLTSTTTCSPANLSTLVGSPAPTGASLRFHTSATPTSANLVATPTAAPAGTYYAFYFDATNNCYSPASAAITVKNCVDLTPTVDIDNLSFTPASVGTTRDFVVNLYEIKGGATSGAVTFAISKISGWTFTYPTTNVTANVAGAGNPTTENANWTFTETAGFITVTSKPGVVIPANGQAILGFRVTRKPSIAPFTNQNLTVSITTGTGGDTVQSNNLSSTILTTSN